MTTAQLLAQLYGRGITLWVEENKLKYRAPHGALSDDLKSQLAARKTEIIEFLQAGALSPAAIPAAPRGQPLPLSFAEEELWLTDQMQPGITAWNMQAGLRIHGALDVAAFQRSLNGLIERHEILRTSFCVRDGAPVRVIAPALTAEVSAVSLPPSKDIEEEIGRIAATDKNRPFDLSAAPLFRLRLLRCAEERHVLLFTFHHMISDASSTRIFFRDLMALYQADVEDRPPVLSDLAVHYADYAAWVRQQGRESVAAHLAYWRSKLNGAVVTEIPRDRRRPEHRNYRGATQRIALPSAVSPALRDLCRQEQATVFMLLVAAFKLLLRRYTGVRDIVVGSVVTGRDRPELEPLIGMFVNIVPLRTDLSGEISFRELLRRVRAVCLEAYQHQAVPFGKLVEELNPNRGGSRNAFFQVLFDVVQLPPKKIEAGTLVFEPLARAADTARYEIVIRAPETPSGLDISIDYATDLFAPARIAEMSRQYSHLLQQIVENPDRSLDQYTLVTPSARRILPDPAAPLDPGWSGSVPELFVRQVTQQPDKIAVADGSETWSYRELNRRANQVAWCLRHHGVGREDVVALYGPCSAGLVCALIGVLKAGAAFFILDSKHPMRRLENYCETIRPKALITVACAGAHASKGEKLSFEDQFRCRIELPPRNITDEEGGLSKYSQEDPAVAVNPDDLACVIFTSGSTGKPKAVMGRHSPLTHFVPWISQTFQISARDRFSALAGLSSNILQREICTALCVGATLCIPNFADITGSGNLDQWMRDEGITIVHLTPAMAQVLDESATQAVPSVRRVFFAGDLLKMRDVDKVRKIMPGAEIVNFYASSESQRAGGYLIITEQQEFNAKEIPPLGRGAQDVQLLVMNACGQMAGIGELGEIWVRSPHLARGYLGDEKLTAERFLANPFTTDPKDRIYRTGEQGRFLPTGEVEFAGRSENQVSIRGFRVELGEVESALEYHPAVRDVVVIGCENHSGNQRLIGYIVPKNEPAPSPNELRVFLKQTLPDYMVPSAFIFLNELPRSANGKVDRVALPELDQSRPDLDNHYVAPRTPVEKILAEIWAEILNVEKIGVHDNFFDLGGHSILAVRLAAEVEKRFRRSISAGTPFQAPTISHMARVLSEANEARPWLIGIQIGGALPPFFCVYGHEIYFALARQLGPDQPLYGLAQHFDGRKVRNAGIEQIAAQYIDEVQKVQSHGPYFIGGFSTGGIIAFEMARQLLQRGETTALLALFDVDHPVTEEKACAAGSDADRPWRRTSRNFSSPGELSKSVSAALFNSAKIVTCYAYRAVNRRLPRRLQSFYLSKIANARLDREARRHCELKPYAGRVIFFTARQDPDRPAPWRALAQDGIEIQLIPGARANLFAEPGITVLAQRLKSCLERARRDCHPVITNLEALSEERVSCEDDRPVA